MRLRARTATADQTQRLGERVGERLPGGAYVVVTGPLGAGKTTMVRGLCRGLGVEEEITSPTFILLQEFEGRYPVAHLDLYRLEHESEIEALGAFELVGGDTVLLVEWGERSEFLMSHSDAVIELALAPDGARDVNVLCTPALARSLEGLDAWL